MKQLKITVAIALVLSVAATMSGCPDKKGDESQVVLATVNDRPLTPDDFAISIDLLYPPAERTKIASPEGRRQFMDQLVLMELFYQEGVAQGYEEDPRIKKILENYKRYLIYDTMMNRGVDESAMVNYFRNNFVHIAVIFVAKPAKADDAAAIEAAKAKATKLREEVVGGADFAEVAKRSSEHPSAKFGGDCGAITRSTGWEVEMVDAALALTQQEPISQVVESASGFWVVKMLHPVGSVPMEYLTTQIKAAVYRYLIGQNFATYAAQLQSQAKVDIKTEVLDGLVLEGSHGVGGAPLQPLQQEGIPGVDPIIAPK